MGFHCLTQVRDIGSQGYKGRLMGPFRVFVLKMRQAYIIRAFGEIKEFSLSLALGEVHQPMFWHT